MQEQVVFRGDIWYVNLSRTIDKSMSTQRQLGTRPCIISSNNMYNKYSPTIQVIPLSTQIHKKSPVHVDVGLECGIDRQSVALVEQETTIDKVDLTEKVGECTIQVMEHLKRAIIKQKDIDEPFDINRLKRFIRAITETQKGDLDENQVIKSVLVYEFKCYCGQYGYDYKEMYNKYKYQFVNKQKEVQLVINKKEKQLVYA